MFPNIDFFKKGRFGGGNAPLVYASNLVLNGDFSISGTPIWSNWASNLADGSITNDTANFISGNSSAKITSGATLGTYIYSDAISVTAGLNYNLDFWSHGDGSVVPIYHVYDVTHSNWILYGAYIGNYSTSYFRHIQPIAVPAGCTQIIIFLACPNIASHSVNFDKITFYKVTSAGYLFDRFSRADEIYNTDGISPTGQIYTTQGNLGQMGIVGGLLDVPNLGASGGAYLLSVLPSAPLSMTTRFKWINNGSGYGDSVVMASSNILPGAAFFPSMIHFYVTTLNWNIDVVDAGGAFTSIGGASFTTPLTIGQEYIFGMSIAGNTVTLTIPTISNQTITDSRIGTYAGKYIFYEIYRTDANKKTAQILEINAKY